MAGRKPGGPKTGGRQKGTPNKRSANLAQYLESVDCRPEEILARICNGEPLTCRLNVGEANTDDDFVEAEVLPTFDQRMAAAKELMQYVHAKRKAVEHSTIDEEGLPTGLKVMFVHD